MLFIIFFLFLLLLFFFFLLEEIKFYERRNKHGEKISQMTEATEIKSDDISVVVQDGEIVKKESKDLGEL